MQYRAITVLLTLSCLVLFTGCPQDESDPALDTTPPAAVIDLAASTGVGFGQIDLAWTATRVPCFARKVQLHVIAFFMPKG